MPHNQPAHLLRPELQSLLVRWFLAAKGRAMPRRADLPVRALSAWRENVVMVLPDAYGYRDLYHFRICGTALAARLGRAMNLKDLHDIDAALRAPLHETLVRVRASGAPTVARADVPRGDGTFVTWCDMVLPFSGQRGVTDRLLFASYAATQPQDAARDIAPGYRGFDGDPVEPFNWTSLVPTREAFRCREARNTT